MDGFLTSALAAFGGGALSFLSPCVLPLVPGYLCFAAGLQFSELEKLEAAGAAKQIILAGAVAFVAGFSTVFILLGAGAAAINPLLLAHQQVFAQLAGGLIVLLGLHVAHILRLPFLERELRFASAGSPTRAHAKLATAYLMGLAFAFGWTPCIGPILAGILALAATRESLGEGVLLLAIYAAGLGLPFILAALGVGRFIATARHIKKYMAHIERGTGGLLVATGLLIMFGTLQSLGSFLFELFPALGVLG